MNRSALNSRANSTYGSAPPPGGLPPGLCGRERFARKEGGNPSRVGQLRHGGAWGLRRGLRDRGGPATTGGGVTRPHPPHDHLLAPAQPRGRMPGVEQARIDDRAREQRGFLRAELRGGLLESTSARPLRRRRCRRPTRSRSDTARGCAACSAPLRAGARSTARGACESGSSTATGTDSWRAAA